MRDLILLWGYGLAFFSVAYLLPSKLYPVRLILGYTSLVVFGASLIGVLIPSVTDFCLFLLNGGVKLAWNLTE